MSASSPSTPALRASDADRDRTIELLRAAVGDGRLDPDEFGERLDAALTARTLDALTPLITDLVVPELRPLAQSPGGALAMPSDWTQPERLVIKEHHGSARREGRWTLPHRLDVRTAWSKVTLDLSEAVYGAPELLIDLKVQGGKVALTLAPGMTVDANELSVRHSTLSITKDPDDDTPRTLHVSLVGKLRHASLDTRWSTDPRR